MPYTDFDTDVRDNPASLEYGKFIKINESDSRFPYVSSTREIYAETGVTPDTQVDVYPHTAVLTYVVNASDISSGGGGGGTTPITNNWNIITYNASPVMNPLPSNTAKKITIINDSGDAFTGKNVAIKRSGASTSNLVMTPGMIVELELVANTNEVSISATDSCTIHAVWSNQV